MSLLSKAEEFLTNNGFNFYVSGVSNFAVSPCPACKDTRHKCYMSFEPERDGLWDCKICGQSGNLTTLRKEYGISNDITVSIQDKARAAEKADAIPDIAAASWRLFNDENYASVLDHLVVDRGISVAVLEERKIGANKTTDGKLWVSYPYFSKSGEPVYVKYRSVPPAKKEFRGLRGRENPLYNHEVIGTTEDLIMVEGEIDTLTLLSQGITNVVGIPGASMKKADWLKNIDASTIKVVYLLYDNDKVGQDNAKDMAIRIGINKVRNVLLPEFSYTVEGGEQKVGKDVNEWFRAGFTVDDFAKLLAEAKSFDVNGVQNLSEVLRDLEREFEEHGSTPTLDTPWPSLTRRIGGCEWGDLVGILADAKVGKSTMALNWVDYYARQGHTSFFFCQEMKPTRVVRKWVSFVTQTDDSPENSQMTVEKIREAVSVGGTYKADLLFGYTKFNKASEVFDTIRQAVRRYGVKVVCFDNLQMLSRSMDNLSQEMSILTKDFKSLAMELNILMLLIMQPKRIGDGKLISAHDAYGSSAIPKDVDAMLVAHRNRVGITKESEFTGLMETSENFEPNMLVRADLTRYAAGGSCTLWMDGAKSTVKELTPDMLTSLPKMVGGTVEVVEA